MEVKGWAGPVSRTTIVSHGPAVLHSGACAKRKLEGRRGSNLEPFMCAERGEGFLKGRFPQWKTKPPPSSTYYAQSTSGLLFSRWRLPDATVSQGTHSGIPKARIGLRVPQWSMHGERNRRGSHVACPKLKGGGGSDNAVRP